MGDFGVLGDLGEEGGAAPSKIQEEAASPMDCCFCEGEEKGVERSELLEFEEVEEDTGKSIER